MQELNWIYILYLIAGIPSFIILSRIAYKDRSLSASFFSGSLFSFVIAITIGMIQPPADDIAREWGDLVAITLVLCGILSEIRSSKPVFVRFPVYLTGLPLIGIIFYPLIIDVEAVENLLIMTYETGALIVSVLVVAINQYLFKGRGVLIVGVIILLAAYVLFWFFGFINEIALTAKILFAVGIIISAVGFHKIQESNKNNLITSL